MYCSKCRRRLFYQDLEQMGWCESCGAVVTISRCKVSFWTLTATLILLWVVQVAS